MVEPVRERRPGRGRLAGRGDTVAAALLAAVGFAGAAGGLSLGVWVEGRPGPGLIPVLAGGAVALSAGLLALLGFLGPPRPAPPAAPEGRRKVAAVLALMAAYVVLLEPAGYVPTTAAFLLALLRLVERVPLRVAVPVAVGAALLLAALFSTVLKLQLHPWPPWIS